MKNTLAGIFSKLLIYVLMLVAIVWGTIDAIKIVRIYTASSASIGTVDFETTETDAVFTYDFGKAVAFYPEGSAYKVSMTSDKTDFDGSDGGRYTLYLNGLPCDMTEVKAGLVRATAYFEFYGVDGNVSAVCDLRITIAFYSDKTEVEVTTMSGASALGHFTHMTESEGFVLTLEKEITIQEGFNE